MSSLRYGPAVSLPTTLVICMLAWHSCPIAGMLPAAKLTQVSAAAGFAVYAACGMAEKAVRTVQPAPT